MENIIFYGLVGIFAVLFFLVVLLYYELEKEYKAHKKTLNEFINFINETEKENRG